jgi:PKD repeat protein
VTFTLGTDALPAPPTNAPLPSVMIGTNTGSSVTHPNQYSITARFKIPPLEPVGAKEASVVFSTPNGTLTLSKSAAFQVTAGSGVATDLTAALTIGTVPLAVAFSDTSTGMMANRLWDFRAVSQRSNPKTGHPAMFRMVVARRAKLFGPSTLSGSSAAAQHDSQSG